MNAPLKKMRLCMIGKCPPIQGGVSRSHYATALGLAQKGHEIHLVTNAKEVEAEFRLMMAEQDWNRLSAKFKNGGLLKVHFTAEDYTKQRHIPWHNPYAVKLASLASEVCQQNNLELISSFYFEPYTLAGHLAAEMTGLPHVTRCAGSDSGRLIYHPQLGPVYWHILKQCAGMFVATAIRKKLKAEGINPKRFFSTGKHLMMPEFKPEGPSLDLLQVKDQMKQLTHSPVWQAEQIPEGPYLGIYGKHSERKGIYDLLAAAGQLKAQGIAFGLLILGRGRPAEQARLEEKIKQHQITDRVLQIPYLPPWRVPEFLRLCRAVCYLERNFDVPHLPIIPREILACGSPMVVSAEKLLLDPLLDTRMIHGYNCVTVKDVTNINELTQSLTWVLNHPEKAEWIGKNGLIVSQEIEANVNSIAHIESIYQAVLSGDTSRVCISEEHERFYERVGTALCNHGSMQNREEGEKLLYRWDDMASSDAIENYYPQAQSGLYHSKGQVQLPASIQDIQVNLPETAIKFLQSLDGSQTLEQIAKKNAIAHSNDPRSEQAVRDGIMHFFKLGLVRLRKMPVNR